MGDKRIDADVASRASALTRTTSQSRNLWNAYLGAFWENTIIEGQRIKDWEVHFSITPTGKDGKALVRMTPEQVNEYVTLLIRKTNEAYYYWNKIQSACINLEDRLSAEVKGKIRDKVSWYQSPEAVSDEGKRLRCPAKDTLLTTAEADLAEEFACLRRGQMEARFFETIIANLRAAQYQIQNIGTANAHELRMLQ